jgi:predicted enzyme related to lactoylglutathione lyase
MPNRATAPVGAPCWADLWTSDVEGSRRFYGEILGWESDEPNPEFGGYFMFTRDGVPVAGGMPDMPDMPANNTWKIYLASDDIAKTAEAAEAEGATLVTPVMPVADIGIQVVMTDPAGATVGVWQPLTFPGFTVVNETGGPSWFELYTRDHAGSVAFYRSVFHWDTSSISDTDEFRYTTMRDPLGGEDLAGIMDAKSVLPEGTPAQWSVYWQVDDVAATVAKVKALGGTVVIENQDTPYGRLASVTDPAGARFNLRTPPAAS